MISSRGCRLRCVEQIQVVLSSREAPGRGLDFKVLKEAMWGCGAVACEAETSVSFKGFLERECEKMWKRRLILLPGFCSTDCKVRLWKMIYGTTTQFLGELCPPVWAHGCKGNFNAFSHQDN